MKRATASMIAGVAAAGLLALAPAAQAQQETGFYLGGTIGQSDADVDCEGTATCDAKDTAWRIFGGYQINRHFAVEVGYHDLGKVSATFTTPIAGDVSIKSNAWEFLAVGKLPVANQFSLYGKAGLFRGEAKASANVVGLGSGSLKETNIDLTYGFGAQYDFSRQVSIRGEWQRYTNLGDNATIGEADIDVLGVGVLVRF